MMIGERVCRWRMCGGEKIGIFSESDGSRKEEKYSDYMGWLEVV